MQTYKTCPDCKLLLGNATSIMEDDICPSCGEDLNIADVREVNNIINSNPNHCAKCDSYFQYDRDQRECQICDSYMRRI